MLSVIVFSLLSAQTPAVAPTLVTPPAPRFRRAMLMPQKDAALSFSVETSAGLVSGTIPVKSWRAKGLDGRGRLHFEIEFDPQKVSVGDKFIERFMRENVLPKRIIASGSGRLAAPKDGEYAQMTVLQTWIVLDRRAPKYSEVHYLYEPKPGGGASFLARHKMSFEELGLKKVPHPFVEIMGKITLELSATLVPEVR